MRQQLVGICVLSLALMTSPLASFAQQEIASDAGEVVLDATVNTIDVENQLRGPGECRGCGGFGHDVRRQ
jgi:hypothetical protein